MRLLWVQELKERKIKLFKQLYVRAIKADLKISDKNSIK